jgi:hypothetical protein
VGSFAIGLLGGMSLGDGSVGVFILAQRSAGFHSSSMKSNAHSARLCTFCKKTMTLPLTQSMTATKSVQQFFAASFRCCGATNFRLHAAIGLLE